MNKSGIFMECHVRVQCFVSYRNLGFLTHAKAQLVQHVFQEWSYVEVLFGFDEG